MFTQKMSPKMIIGLAIILLILLVVLFTVISGSKNSQPQIQNKPTILTDADLSVSEDFTGEVQEPERRQDASPALEESKGNEYSYFNGQYEGVGSYEVSANQKFSISLAVTLVNDVVTDASIVNNNIIDLVSPEVDLDDLLAQFVIGVPLDDIEIEEVGAQELQIIGLNQAIANIQAQAAR